MVNKLSVEDEKLAILSYAHRIFDSIIVITVIYCFIHRHQLHGIFKTNLTRQHAYIETQHDYSGRTLHLHDFRHYKIFMQWIFYPTLYISFKLATLYFDIKNGNHSCMMD